MYFKITGYGDDKYTDIGMIEVTASYYLEKGDEGYSKYFAEFPSCGPFRNHSIRFESDVTSEEISAAFENDAEDMQDAYLDDDIHRLKNDSNDEDAYLSRKEQYDSIREIPAEEQTADMKIILAKVTEAQAKVLSLRGEI